MKPCTKCGAEPTYVSPRTNKPHGWCRGCLNAATRDWHHRSGRRAARYGLFPSDLSAMRLMQGDRCDVCGDSFRRGVAEHVDHDHATGQVRALLCGSCNQGLGNFKDDPRRLVNAAAYLRRWS